MAKVTTPQRRPGRGVRVGGFLRETPCLLAVLVLAGALLGPAAAQSLPPTQPGVTLVLGATGVEVGAGNATEVTGTVANVGPADGTVAFTLTVPEGWDVTTDPPSSFTLAAGASATFSVLVVAPAAGAGATGEELLVAATLTEANTNRAATAEQSLTLTRVDPPAPPPPPPPYGLYAAIAGTAAALVLVGTLLYVRARNQRLARERAAAEEARRKAEHEAYLARETGIGISLLDGPRKFGTRRELVFRVAVENQTQRERNAVIGVAQHAEGWTAACAVPKAALAPGERVVVTFYANPSDAVPTGAKATLAFFAKPEEAQELDQRVSVEVVAPDARVPELGDRPVTAPRDPVAPRPVLRF